jgi:hypothetical protein
LHPHNEKRLYELIEKLIDASIPLWNATLAPLADGDFERHQRILYAAVEYDPDPESWPASEQIQQLPDESNNDYWERKDQWIQATQRLVFPEPFDFAPLPQPAPFDLKSTYGKRGLQVIVKLASIHLTPEKPEYEGGTWHVEGQMVCILFFEVGKILFLDYRTNTSCLLPFTITQPKISRPQLSPSGSCAKSRT